MNKTVFGLQENIAAALSNLTCGLFGIVLLIKERENRFVRFHAMQSIITFFGLAIISGILSLLSGGFSAIPVLGWIVGMPLGIVSLAVTVLSAVAWVYLTFTAYQGKDVKVPLIGDAVLKQLDK